MMMISGMRASLLLIIAVLFIAGAGRNYIVDVADLKLSELTGSPHEVLTKVDGWMTQIIDAVITRLDFAQTRISEGREVIPEFNDVGDYLQRISSLITGQKGTGKKIKEVQAGLDSEILRQIEILKRPSPSGKMRHRITNNLETAQKNKKACKLYIERLDVISGMLRETREMTVELKDLYRSTAALSGEEEARKEALQLLNDEAKDWRESRQSMD